MISRAFLKADGRCAKPTKIGPGDRNGWRPLGTTFRRGKDAKRVSMSKDVVFCI